MKFSEWLKKNLDTTDEIRSDKVLNFTKNKLHPRARIVEEEIQEVLNKYGWRWMFIPIVVWDNPFYDFDWAHYSEDGENDK